MRQQEQLDILLDTPLSRELFFGAAHSLPVVDLFLSANSVKLRCPTNVTELWLRHNDEAYSLMRLCGVDDKYLGSQGSDYEVFRAFCGVMPLLVGHPFYTRTQLLLHTLFGIDTILNEHSCDEVWTSTSEALSSELFGAEAICRRLNACSLGALYDGRAPLQPSVLPTAALDAYMALDEKDVCHRLTELGASVGCDVRDLSSLYTALLRVLDRTAEQGGRVALHDIRAISAFESPNEYEADQALKAVLGGTRMTFDERTVLLYRTQLLRFLGQQYQKREMVCALKIDGASVNALPKLLHYLDAANALPRTVLLAEDGCDLGALAALCAEFSGKSGHPRLCVCPADWHKDAPERLEQRFSDFAAVFGVGNLMELTCHDHGLVAPCEHEYFRRVLCRWIGHQVQGGLLAQDVPGLSRLIECVCLTNTEHFLYQ